MECDHEGLNESQQALFIQPFIKRCPATQATLLLLVKSHLYGTVSLSKKYIIARD